MKGAWSKAVAVSALVLIGFLTAGCSTQAQRVDCEWRLRPINPPLPMAPAASPKEGADKR